MNTVCILCTILWWTIIHQFKLMNRRWMEIMNGFHILSLYSPFSNQQGPISSQVPQHTTLSMATWTGKRTTTPPITHVSCRPCQRTAQLLWVLQVKCILLPSNFISVDTDLLFLALILGWLQTDGVCFKQPFEYYTVSMVIVLYRVR